MSAAGNRTANSVSPNKAIKGILLPLFITLALGCLYRYFQNKDKGYWLYLCFILFGLSWYTYDIGKLFLGLLFLGLLSLYFDELLPTYQRYKHYLIALLIFIVILIPGLINQFQHPESLSRFGRITIFNLPMSSERIALLFVNNWLAHYSPQFLFLYGDSNIRHSMPFTGQLYLFELPLVLFGIYYLWHLKRKIGYLLLIWLLVYPIPASLTAEGIPHALRSICVLPLFSIISALGLVQLLLWLKIDFTGSIRGIKQGGFAIFLFLALFNIAFCLYGYFKVYPVISARDFQAGMKTAVQYAESVKTNYDQIYVSPSLGYPEIFFLFYTKQNPDNPQVGPPYRFNVPNEEVEQSLTSETSRNLYLVMPQELNQIKPFKLVFGPDGQPLLKFVINPPLNK